MNKVKRVNQFGRSMIEMLGVLAIIGVLSVGGIAGYTKAQHEYKMNKTIEQITTIINNVETTFIHDKSSEFRCSSDEWSSSPCNFLKSTIIPDEMRNSDVINHALGGEIQLIKRENYAAIIIEGLSREECSALATKDWKISDVYVVHIYYSIDEDEDALNFCWADDYSSLDYYCNDEGNVAACSSGSKYTIPLPMNVAVKGCQCENNDCEVTLGFMKRK